MTAGLLLGLVALAAMVGGYAAHAARTPRVVGYLLGGVGAKLMFDWTLDEGLIESVKGARIPLDAVTHVALGAILLSIGSVFETEHLKRVGARVLRVVAWESGGVVVLVALGTFAATFVALPDIPLGVRIALGVLFGLAATETAPAATLFVLREYEAKGPISDMILSVTGVNNILCLLGWGLAFLVVSALGMTGQSGAGAGTTVAAATLLLVGSPVLGGVLGLALAIAHAKLPLADSLILLAGMLLALGAGEGALMARYDMSYSFLVAVLAMSAVFWNVAIDPGRLEGAVRTFSRPFIVAFFGLAGFKVDLGALASLGVLGGAYVACRAIGKIGGGAMAARSLRRTARLNQRLGLGLACQAALAVGLAQFAKTHWVGADNEPTQAALAFANTLLGAALIFELIGPFLLKHSVVASGEVKAVTLLRRTASGAEAPPEGIVRLTWRSLLRTLGLRRTPSAPGADRDGDGVLTVGDVMRTNVKCLPAVATFDDVLQFVEQVRYSHFPVIDDDDRLVGVLHFRDIRDIIYDTDLVNLLTAADLAATDATAVETDMALEELVELFGRLDVASLPVIDASGERRVVGIIEQRDVLRALRGRANAGETS